MTLNSFSHDISTSSFPAQYLLHAMYLPSSFDRTNPDSYLINLVIMGARLNVGYATILTQGELNVTDNSHTSHFFRPFFTFCGGGVFPLPGTMAIPVVPFLCRSVHPTKLSITPSKLSFSPTASSFLANQYVKFSLACEVTAFKLSTCASNSSTVIPCNANSDTLALCRAATGSNGGASGAGFPESEGAAVSGLVLGRTSFFFFPEAGRISSRFTGMPSETRKSRRIRERFQSGGFSGPGAASWFHCDIARSLSSRSVGTEGSGGGRGFDAGEG